MSEKPPTFSLEELDAKLKVARGQRPVAGTEGTESDIRAGAGLGMALKIGVEFVSAVGVGVGLLLDYWLETKPWLMIVFFLLGSAAGFLNIFRTMSGYGYAAGYNAKYADKKSDRTGSE